MLRSLNRPDILVVTLAAAGILMVTMGARQSLGLFIAPIETSTGLGIATISLALAIGQFTWGAIQPVAGAVADRYGPLVEALYSGAERAHISTVVTFEDGRKGKIEADLAIREAARVPASTKPELRRAS